MTAALFDLTIQGSKDGGDQDGENSRDQRNPGLAETDRNPDRRRGQDPFRNR